MRKLSSLGPKIIFESNIRIIIQFHVVLKFSEKETERQCIFYLSIISLSLTKYENRSDFEKLGPSILS